LSCCEYLLVSQEKKCVKSSLLSHFSAIDPLNKDLKFAN
jgi:hypothetical protein